MGVRRVSVLALALSLTVSGCTADDSTGSTGTVTLPSPSAPPTVTTTATSTVQTGPPAAPDDLTTGPGVTDTSITAAVLLGADPDAGLTDGIRLYQQSVNQAGGICGRSLEFVTETGDPEAAYRRRASTVLGFLLPSTAGFDTVASASDQMPVLAVSGSSAELTAQGPVVLGATDDVKAINALAYLVAKGKVPAHGTVGVLAGSDPGALNGLAGARWWADRAGLTLDVRTAVSGTGWGDASAVLALTDATTVNALLAATPPELLVVTTMRGYDPATLPASAKDRLMLTVSTPAFGSDHPAAAAVAKAFSESSGNRPGPRVLPGYALAAGWGRLLTKACADRTLTRAGLHTAMTTVGPAGVDSLFGPYDPALVVTKQLPATLISSMAMADPQAPAGLRPLVWTQTASGIDEYVPAR